jgi:Sulfotransferase domain
MKVWLASYPRSGNTFLRIVLNNVFGLRSASLYKGETAVFNEIADAASVIGHDEKNSGDAQDVDEPEGLRLVKTHGKPTDDSQSIYIVRDGRTTLVSYYHYYKSYVDEQTRFEDVITGKHWPGSWSEHFDAWNPSKRERTLLVRYEDLRDRNDETCQKIGNFLQKQPLRKFDIAFSELQTLNPKFFRTSNDAKSLEEIEPFLNLFMEYHGAAMQELGYV